MLDKGNILDHQLFFKHELEDIYIALQNIHLSSDDFEMELLLPFWDEWIWPKFRQFINIVNLGKSFTRSCLQHFGVLTTTQEINAVVGSASE